MRGKAAATRVLWVAIGASISAGVGFVWLQRTGSWGDSTPASVRAPVAAAAARGRRRVAVEVQLDTAEAVLQPEEGPAGEGTNHGTAPPWQVESSSPLVLAYGVQGRIALPPSNKGDGGLLENARAVYGEMSTEILARWGKEYANTSIFSGGMNFSDGGKVVEDKMLNAVVGQGSFVAAFTGYSNTAGHDCLYEESYPVLLNETMGRLMAAAGTRFQGMNVAMGNTPPSPYSYCVDAHAGLDADIVSWDMSMAVSSRKCGSAASLIELFIRSASVLPKRPAVLIMDSSPDAETCGTPAYVASVYNRNYRLFTGACDPKRPLMKLYRDFGLHQLASGSLVSTVACGDERFSRSSLYNATEKTYPNTMKWHPGPAGHLLLADMLFMHYAAVFLSALDRLEVVAPGITATQLREKDAPSITSLATALGLRESAGIITRPEAEGAGDEGSGSGGAYMGGGRGDILPPPAWCKGWRFCDGAGDYRCANTYFPLAGTEGSRLADMVSERTPTVANLDHTEYVVRPTEGHWAVTLNEMALPLLDYLTVPPPEGKHKPIDMKWVLVGDNLSGPIEFEFETVGVRRGTRWATEETQQGALVEGEKLSSGTAVVLTDSFESEPRVVVCRPDFIDHVIFNDTAAVRFSIDGTQAPVVQLEQPGLRRDSCSVLDVEIGAGRHTLTVEPLKDGEPLVAISHVLYPA